MSCCEGGADFTDYKNEFDLHYRDVLYRHHWNHAFLETRYEGRTDNFAIKTDSRLCFQREEARVDYIPRTICHNVKLTTFYTKGRALSTHFLPCGTIKFGAHLGTLKLGNHQPELRAIFKTDKSLAAWTGKLALDQKTESYENHTTLRGNCCGDELFTIANTFLGKHTNYRFGGKLKLNLNKFSLLKYDAFAVYRHNDRELSLEHLSNKGSDSLSLGNVILSLVHHHKKGDCVASVNYSQQDKNYIATVGGSCEINPNLNVKWRLEDWKNLVFSSNIKVNNHVKLGLGTGFDISSTALTKIIGDNSFRLPIGFGLEFNS